MKKLVCFVTLVLLAIPLTAAHAVVDELLTSNDQINSNDPGAVNEFWTTDTPLNHIVGTGPFAFYRAQPKNPTSSPIHITFNFNSKNEELVNLFSLKNFRAAMEFALDRE